MKSKLNKHKKSETKLDPKTTMKTNSKDNNNTIDSADSTNNTTNQQQNNTYPPDIQGLFERLGIA